MVTQPSPIRRYCTISFNSNATGHSAAVRVRISMLSASCLLSSLFLLFAILNLGSSKLLNGLDIL
ncbi:hypothetical protein BDN72DRAFT_535983 [Pluteus cervinus]|uniref:Uncharacterized protein n=1 Tax=Pluteus cervinus TaxID=181527 RepID=A0ACD3AXP0_9AGAR|nr:hypothetical protein BDN72DRAFT_535983 [Pluteus cervinus]